MPRRFLLPQPLNVPRVVLTGGEAHHLTNVLRQEVGDEVLLFDGAGTEARARIVALNDGVAELEILSSGPAETETPRPIILATAVPKGDRFEWLVEKATELGVARIIPLLTERSIVNPGAGKLDKLRHAVVAASKQCGRSRLLQLDAPIAWNDFLKQETGPGQFYVADPSGDPLTGFGEESQPLLFALGPEGGFTERELTAALAAGARLVSLGPRILRIETAALALATLAALGR